MCTILPVNWYSGGQSHDWRRDQPGIVSLIARDQLLLSQSCYLKNESTNIISGMKKYIANIGKSMHAISTMYMYISARLFFIVCTVYWFIVFVCVCVSVCVCIFTHFTVCVDCVNEWIHCIIVWFCCLMSTCNESIYGAWWCLSYSQVYSLLLQIKVCMSACVCVSQDNERLIME